MQKTAVLWDNLMKEAVPKLPFLIPFLEYMS